MRFLSGLQKEQIKEQKKTDIGKSLTLFLIYKLMDNPCEDNIIRIGILYREIFEYEKSSIIFENYIKDKNISEYKDDKFIKACKEYIYTLKDCGKYKKAIDVYDKYLLKCKDSMLEQTIEFIKKQMD